jgi:hypothetical protein
MRKYFKAVNEKAADGWMLGFSTGNSGIDNEDWVVDTNSLHADQIPEYCSDAKLFAQLVAGLLNCYYNNVPVTELPEEQVANLGIVNEEIESIPSAKNPEFLF